MPAHRCWPRWRGRRTTLPWYSPSGRTGGRALRPSQPRLLRHRDRARRAAPCGQCKSGEDGPPLVCKGTIPRRFQRRHGRTGSGFERPETAHARTSGQVGSNAAPSGCDPWGAPRKDKVAGLPAKPQHAATGTLPKWTHAPRKVVAIQPRRRKRAAPFGAKSAKAAACRHFFRQTRSKPKKLTCAP